MTIHRFAAILLLAAAVGFPAAAQAPSKPVRIGVITDMTGSLSAQSGQGSVVAAQLAIDDCLAGPCKGMAIELLSADHQNKPDLAVGIVRKWIDVDGVDAVTDIIQAAVQLAVQHVMAEKHRIALFPGGTARLHQEDCAPATSVQWMWDTYGQAVGIAKPLAKPGSKWFFITADYAFGLSLEADATRLIEAAGGKVVGHVRHPFNYAGDFSPFLLQAQSSGADVIALGSTGADLISLLKQAREFGVGGEGPAGRELRADGARHRGARAGRGAGRHRQRGVLLEPRSRSPSLVAALRGKAMASGMPSTIQAGVYSVTLHYLRAVAAAGTTETDAVMRKMHELPVGDATIRNGTLRPDGRMVHDSYLFKVKTPAESREPFDFYNTMATIPAAEAFRPLADSACPAFRKG